LTFRRTCPTAGRYLHVAASVLDIQVDGLDGGSEVEFLPDHCNRRLGPSFSVAPCRPDHSLRTCRACSIFGRPHVCAGRGTLCRAWRYGARGWKQDPAVFCLQNRRFEVSSGVGLEGAGITISLLVAQIALLRPRGSISTTSASPRHLSSIFLRPPPICPTGHGAKVSAAFLICGQGARSWSRYDPARTSPY
jgi:hypothetical protein